MHLHAGRRFGGQAVLCQRQQPPANARKQLAGRGERAAFARRGGEVQEVGADLDQFDFAGCVPGEEVDEAIVNAVAHRDYAISGSKIRLFLFANRLELYYSPGKLANTITLDEMPYRTFTRNKLLVSFLSRIRSKRTGQVFLESRREGVRKILQDGEAHSGRRPRYELLGDELRLTLWARLTPSRRKGTETASGGQE